MSEISKKYVPAAFNYVTAKKVDIANAARDLGISTTAIGAAIAKENDAYETRQGAVRFLDRRLDDYVKLQTYRLGDTMLRSEATAATALGLDEQLKGTAGKALKFAFPTLADVGIANIKVSTAIKLLDDYLANYPADPLGLKDYRNDTGRFVRDLIDPRTPATALVSALMVKEAQDFYLKPALDAQGRQLNIDAATWGAMSPEVRDGLTTMYFTMGKNVMEAKRADNIARNGVYDPRLGEGDSGGLWTFQNAAEIGAALGVAGYGQTPINGLTLESNTTFINLPNSSTGSFGLISYASDYAVRINVGGTLSHIVAAEAAKGNVISVADLRAVNYDIRDVADSAIPSGAVLLVPRRVGESLVVDSGNARISFNPTTGEYLAITQSSANGPTFIYERKLVDGTLVDRFIQTDSAINGLDLADGNPTTLPVSLTDLADHTGGSLIIGDERTGSQLTTLASEGNGNYGITAEIGGQSVSLGAIADNDSDNVRVTGISSINDQPLDTLGTGTYGLDADDYLSFGLTFNNLLNGTVGAAGEALITGLDPATQATTGAPVPQVQITELAGGQSWRSLEVAGGTTFSTLRDDEGNVISATYSRELGAGVKLSEVYDGANTLLYTEKIEPVLTGANAGQLKETLIRPDGSGFVFQRGVDGQEIADTRVRVAPYDQRLASTFSDVSSFIDAIKGGKPLPILANGLRLLNDLDQLVTPGGSLPQLGTANTIAAGALSLYNLNNALKHGDAFDKLSATAFALNGTTNALIAANVISKTGAAANLLGAGSPLASTLPYLGLISAIKAGDPIGAAMSIGTLVQGSAFLTTNPVGWALIGVQLLRSFMDKGPPDAWGVANVTFGPGITNYLSQVNTTGENFGPDRVRSQLQSTLDALNSIIAQTNSSNPDSNQHLGIIPQRLPSLNYRASEFADKGYSVTDIDALTGAQRFHNIRFDDSGQVFNLDPASITPELRAMLSLTGAPNYPQLNAYMLNSALDRQAIAPLWEVKTARMQESVRTTECRVAPEMIAGCARDTRAEDRFGLKIRVSDNDGVGQVPYQMQATNTTDWRAVA